MKLVYVFALVFAIAMMPITGLLVMSALNTTSSQCRIHLAGRQFTGKTQIAAFCEKAKGA